MCNPEALRGLSGGTQMAEAGDTRTFGNDPAVYESGGYVHKDPKTGEPGVDPETVKDFRWIAPGKDPARKEYWRKQFVGA